MFLDYETRSRRNLQRVGGHVYAGDESTELLCAVALDVRSAPAVVYTWSPWPGPLTRWRAKAEWLEELGIDEFDIVYFPPLLGTDAIPPQILQAAREGVHFCAHNASGFDELVWNGCGLPRTRWVDTVPLARRRGLPGRLEHIAQALFGRGKDKTGQRVMQRSWSPMRKRGEDPLQSDGRLAGRFLDPDGPRLSAIIRYCVRDVLLMAETYFREDMDAPHVDDPVLAVHERIDARGVAVDLRLAALLLAVDRASAAEQVRLANAAFPDDPPPVTSPVALVPWLKARGVKIANCQAPTIRAAME